MAAIWALGLMSGTSLDGVDAAMVKTDGEKIEAYGRHAFRAYSEGERDVLRKAFGAEHRAGQEEAETVLLQAHSDIAEHFPEAELIGFHGQTVSHAPTKRHTLQLGDGAALAAKLKRPVAWDFRSTDVEAGGEGAPLVPLFHKAAAANCGLVGPLAIVNIGGVANVTYIPEDGEDILAWDTGPGNALLDDFMMSQFGKKRDEDGALASTGHIDDGLLKVMLSDPFFEKPAPKSLDRDHFHYLLSGIKGLQRANAAATLTAFTAKTIIRAAELMPIRPKRWLITGGGRHNTTLMTMINERVSADKAEVFGLNGDMLEAQAFAFLALRVRRSLPLTFPGTTGCPRPIAGGRISLP